MKRISYISTVLFAAVVALVACTKENENNKQTSTTHSISFVASQPETKTVMEIRDGKAYFDWEETDKDNIHIYESGVEATKVQAILDPTTRIMSFSAEFPGSEAPSVATYNAHLNSDIRTQKSAATSYDGTCDVLSSKEINVTDRTAEISIVFEREVAVNKMTLKGLGANETISSVTLTSDKAISGVYRINAWTEPSTTLSISPAGVVSDGAGEAVIYFTCLPVEDAQLTVDVTTNKTYSKTFAKTISFEKGKVKSFGVTVEENRGTGTEHEYVDLGLSVKWATMNVGANNPQEYGGYYQWAGTVDVSDTDINLTQQSAPYHASEYPSYNWTKYVRSEKAFAWEGAGDPDNKTVLESMDDAASVNWGGNWRMPTHSEWTELRNSNNCTWTWKRLEGVYGFEVKSKKAGFTNNWIFLPAAGYRDGNNLTNSDQYGLHIRYWSATLSVSEPGCAFSVEGYYHPTAYQNMVNWADPDRYLGLSVRPVRP